MKDKETTLTGGMSTDSVVRIGDTVHRTQSPNAEFAHSLLKWLEVKQFPCSPRFLGVDEQRREVLTFIAGEVPRETGMTMPQKVAAAKMLRQFHDLTAVSDLREGNEVVCHNDFAPWNIIIDQNGNVSGIIDFDDASAGNRLDDLTYYIWTALDLGTAEKSDAEQVELLAELAKAYGVEGSSGFISSLLAQQQRILTFRQHNAVHDEDLGKRAFSKGAILRIRKSMNWVKSNEARIEAKLEEIVI